MPEHITDEDLELLGELGVEDRACRIRRAHAREQRIIAGFEEIERFVEQHGRHARARRGPRYLRAALRCETGSNAGIRRSAAKS